MTVAISLETLEARKKWRIFQVLKELTTYKSVSSKNILQELSEIKTFSDFIQKVAMVN